MQSASANQAILLTAFAVSACVSLALTALLGRALPPEDFGFFALVAVVVALGREAIDLGTTSMAAREIARNPSHERVLLEGLVVWRRLAGILLGMGVVCLAGIQVEPTRRMVLLAAAAAMIAMGPTAFVSAFLVRQAMFRPAMATILNQIILLALCLLLLANGVEGSIFGGLIVARETLWIVAIAILGQSLVGYRLVPGVHGPRLRRFFRAVATYALVVLCHKLYLYSDVLIVLLFRGEQELGAYAAAFRVLMPAFLIPGFAAAPLVPLLAVTATKHHRRYKVQVTQTSRLALGVGALAASLGMVLAPDLAAVLYQGQFLAPPLEVVPAMRWLTAALIPVYVTAAVTVALLATGRERALLAVVGAGLVLNIVANLILVPKYGIEAAALTTMVTESAVCLGVCGLLFKLKSLAWPSLKTWLLLLPGVVAGIVCLLVPTGPILRLGVGIGAGIAGFTWLLASSVGRGYVRALQAPKPVSAESPRGP